MKHTIFPRRRITGNGNLSRAALHIPDKKNRNNIWHFNWIALPLLHETT